MDKDNNGSIDPDELRDVINALNINISESDLQQMIFEIDLDGDGSLDFNEFLTLMSKQKHETDTEEELKEGFEAFDQDKDQYITKNDLKALFKSLGEELSEHELDNMIRVADRNKTGKISFEDF